MFLVWSVANLGLPTHRGRAYWTGVVDEVTGSGLQSDSEMIEMILWTESR